MNTYSITPDGSLVRSNKYKDLTGNNPVWDFGIMIKDIKTKAVKVPICFTQLNLF